MASCFQAGQLSLHYERWADLTSDPEILQSAKSSTIDFTDDPPVQMYPHNSIGKDHITALETEINSLLEKRVTIPSKHEPGEFISPIFSVPKPNG